MTRSRPGCRNSFTNLAGERELRQQGPAGSPDCSRAGTSALGLSAACVLIPGLLLNVETSCCLSLCLSAACVLVPGLLLNMETSCCLFVCLFVGFLKVDLKQMILRMLTCLALDSGFNFTWRPMLGFFSYLVSYCKVPL